MNKKLLKVLGATGLALIMGAGVICGVVTPTGATSASNSGNLAALAQSADSAPSQDLITPQEDDPIICTTESGLKIKYAQATMTPATSPTLDHAGQATSPSGLSGYAYLKMGNYNWIIIGYNTSNTTGTVVYSAEMNFLWADYLNRSDKSKFSSNGFAQVVIDSTPAGIAVQSEASKEIISLSALNFALNYSSAVENTTELSSGEVLVLCQVNIGNSKFHTDQNGYPKYSSSTLLTAMRNLYDPSTSKNDAGFTTSEAALIVSKTLTTAGSSSLTEYLFPLGSTSRASTESFAIEKYLTSSTKMNIGSSCWLRSSVGGSNHGAYFLSVFNNKGSISSTNLADSLGVRPAMVIKI